MRTVLLDGGSSRPVSVPLDVPADEFISGQIAERGLVTGDERRLLDLDHLGLSRHDLVVLITDTPPPAARPTGYRLFPVVVGTGRSSPPGSDAGIVYLSQLHPRVEDLVHEMSRRLNRV